MKKDRAILLRFTQEEKDTLTKKAKQAGLSREQFCRCILNGAEVKAGPSADVPTLIREIRRVGRNIEQILKITNVRGLLDIPQLRKALEDNRATEKLIVDSYTTRMG